MMAELLVKFTTLEASHKKKIDELNAKYDELKMKLEAVMQSEAIKEEIFE